MKKIIALAIFLSLILVMGCLRSEDSRRPRPPAEAEIEYGYGLKILEFAPDYDEIYSGDEFGLNIEVQNVGGYTAQNIRTELGRYGDLDVPAPIQGGGELNPPDEENNIPGDSRYFYWQIKAPEKTSTTDYDVMAKVKYWYSSEASRDYLIMSRERMLERKEQGIESEVESTSTAGPVEIQFSLQPEEIILSFADDEGYGIRTFPIRIDIADLGSGIVVTEKEVGGEEREEGRLKECTRKICCVDSVTLYLQARRPEIFYTIECTRPFIADTVDGEEDVEFEDGVEADLENEYQDDGHEIKIDEKNNQYQLVFEGIQLIDKASIVSCFVESKVDIQNKPYFEQTYFARAKADYDYQIESTAKVTILGQGTS